jgi:ribosomal protein S18 acetylase RimI-like enzyme
MNRIAMKRGFTMEQVRIRACTPDDIEGVIALERLWEQEDIAYGDFNPMSREAYVAFLERFPAYFLVAESDGQLVGYIHASVQRDNPVEVIPAQEPYVAIEDIYVQPDYRDGDIGGALLERIFEIARQEGTQRFTVGTRSKETDRILTFYRSHGFIPWSLQFFK